MRTVRLHFYSLLSLLILISMVTLPVTAQTSETAGEKAQAKKVAQSSKKKKTSTYVPSFVVQNAARPVAPAVIKLQRIEITPLTEGAAAELPRTVRASKSRGVHITPSGVPVTPTAGELIISEFRVRGPNGANDEFIEIYNASGVDHTVTATSGTGYGVAASDGTTRCSIPNGTVLPIGGHYLCVNSVGYSLAAYPAGNGTTATGDATYTTDIPDNAGIALFNNNSGGGSYSLANRLDAVGSTSEANTLYKEGTGYPALTPFSIDYAFTRDECGKGGSITTFGECTITTPKDTDNNAADFFFVDSNGTSAGAGQRLGAPGPQNLSSPVLRNSDLPFSLPAQCTGAGAEPNRVRNFTSDPANNSTFGTLSIRREFINATPNDITRLRFRVIDLTTFPAPSGIADLRPRTSVDSVETNPDCNGGGSINISGTTLEQPPSQPNGGGFNSTLSAGTITLATPLPSNGTIVVNFLLGIQQTGSFKVFVNVEGLVANVEAKP
jgi:hypothetical protein